jgi:hypothetical protein
MANLNFSEKQLIESVFDMSTGYLLDFTNREFKEFMKDVVSYDIYKKYPDLSKAKMFRAFLKDETEPYAGKAIALLIEYMKNKGLILPAKREQVSRLTELAERLLGKDKKVKTESTTKRDYKQEIKYEDLNQSLLNLERNNDRQARGYAFEKYLNELFKAFDLDPRASYKTEYDQIDGSFVLEGKTILVEAKYRSHPIPKNDLILFSQKVENKSPFARGLFITFSSAEEKAIEYFTERSSRLVVLTVEELYIICQNKKPLPEVLKYKYRILDEQGLIFHHVLKM